MGTAFRPARVAQAIAILYLNTILLYRFKIRKFQFFLTPRLVDSSRLAS